MGCHPLCHERISQYLKSCGGTLYRVESSYDKKGTQWKGRGQEQLPKRPHLTEAPIPPNIIPHCGPSVPHLEAWGYSQHDQPTVRSMLEIWQKIHSRLCYHLSEVQM